MLDFQFKKMLSLQRERIFSPVIKRKTKKQQQGKESDVVDI